MINDILTRTRALLDGITPGEWKESGNGERFGSITANVYRNRADDGCDYCIDVPDKNAAFIAAAPALVRELCAEVEKLSFKCGESCPEGETVNDSGQWSLSICPYCGAENEEPWDHESYPNSDWLWCRCNECDREYEVGCCEITYVRARKKEGA